MTDNVLWFGVVMTVITVSSTPRHGCLARSLADTSAGLAVDRLAVYRLAVSPVITSWQYSADNEHTSSSGNMGAPRGHVSTSAFPRTYTRDLRIVMPTFLQLWKNLLTATRLPCYCISIGRIPLAKRGIKNAICRRKPNYSSHTSKPRNYSAKNRQANKPFV